MAHESAEEVWSPSEDNNELLGPVGNESLKVELGDVPKSNYTSAFPTEQNKEMPDFERSDRMARFRDNAGINKRNNVAMYLKEEPNPEEGRRVWWRWKVANIMESDRMNYFLMSVIVINVRVVSHAAITLSITGLRWNSVLAGGFDRGSSRLRIRL